ncbi:MAG: cyclic nucleotide-binding/CBS domain-containing protein, partial [Candidatus Hydrothermarchaeales archaeon]
MLVKNVMSKPVFTVAPTASVVEAASIMKEEKIGCLIVVKSAGKPVGIVTESDFLRKVLAENKTLKTPVEEVMTTDIKTIGEEETIEQAAKIMTLHRIRRLPVGAKDDNEHMLWVPVVRVAD